MEEKELLYHILDDANIGWWRFDQATDKCYISPFIRNKLGIDTDIVSLDSLKKYIKKNSQEEIIQRFILNPNNDFDITLPIYIDKKEKWISLKNLKSVNTSSSYIYGTIKFIDHTPLHSDPQIGLFRLNNLLYRLNIISQNLLLFLNTEDPNSVINKILENILQLFEGGRAYIFEYDSKEKTQSCIYEVVDVDITPQKAHLQNIPMDRCAAWTEQILANKAQIYSDIKDIPESCHRFKEFLTEQNIKSMIAIPLLSRRKIWGYIGIDIAQDYHTWTHEDYQFIASLSNIISICIELQKSEQKAQNDNFYLQSLYEHMPIGYIRLKMVYDSNNNIVDYIFADINYAAERITQTNKEYYLGKKASHVERDLCKELPVIREILKQSEHCELEYWCSSLKTQLLVTVYSLHRDEIICLFSDTTEKYKTNKALDRSERILRNIYDNLPVGIELYDRNGDMVDINNKDIEIFGVCDDIESLKINIFNNPNIPNNIKEQFKEQETVSFNSVYKFDNIKGFYNTHNTGEIELYTTVCRLYDSEGNFIHYLFINIDKTEITNAYNRIEEFERTFDLVAEYGKVGYCKFDLISGKGKGIAQWFHNIGENEYTPLNEIIGVYNYVHESDRNDLLAYMEEMKSGRISGFSKDIRIISEDRVRWTKINVIKDEESSGKNSLEVISISYDITAQKEIERLLISAKEKAEESDRLKSAFLANMSHEIRTPLNAIVGFSNLLSETNNRNDKQLYTNIIQENNELLLQLISDILDLSKIEAGIFQFSYYDFDVNQLIDEIMHTHKSKIKSENIEFKCEKEASYFILKGDKLRINQLLINFINNAIKFTENGSITIGYTTTQSYIRFFVRDTGKGIPQDKLDSIFDRFVKLNSFTQGSGLGLSICKSIVEQMGGEIGVDSEVEKGSCFWFSIPL